MELTSTDRLAILHRIADHAQPQVLPDLELLPRPSLVATGAIFLLSDTLSLLAAPFVAHMLWTLYNPSAPRFHYFWPALVFLWGIFWLKGLYPGVGLTPVEQLRSIVRGTSLIYLILITGVFLMKESDTYSRGVFTLAGLLSLALVPFSRAMVCQFFSPKSWWGAPVVILGAGTTARHLILELKAKNAIGFKPIACLDDDPWKHGWCEGIPVIGPLSLAPQLARSYQVHHAIVAMPRVRRERVLAVLEQCSAAFPHVILIPNLFGISTLWASVRDLSGMLGLEMRYNLLIPYNRWVKRAMDIILSGMGLVIAAPLICLCALVIKLVSPGKAFYLQEREGFGDAMIKIPKLRTMYPDAERKLSEYLRKNPAARMEWDLHCKLKHDPRILPGVGNFLRRTSIDELPQLWNVLKGEMSLVGPRPFPTYHTVKFDHEFRELRRKVVPGLTGLWQISARSDADIQVQTQQDTYYIRNWSIWLDIYILSRTARAVITGNGAY